MYARGLLLPALLLASTALLATLAAAATYGRETAGMHNVTSEALPVVDETLVVH